MRAAPLLVALVAGCASTPPDMTHGVEAYNAGRNDEALQYFTRCAAQGVPPCMHNLGYMFEVGRATSPNSRVTAIQWYTLAARHGLPQSRVALVNLGAAVPAADLAEVPREATPEEMEAARSIGEALGTAIGGGYRKH